MKNHLIILVLFLFFFSCVNEPENDYELYKIKVDKIEAPDTLKVADSLAIKFFGTVGSDGCHSFANFESDISGRKITITVWGRRPNFDTVCPAVMVYLDGKKFKTKLSEKGKYEIVIRQPDDSTLNDFVYVE